MSTSSHSHCPRCGSALNGGSVDGLCAKCLGALNFATQTVMAGDAPIPHSPALTPEQLAPHFPQLEIIECLGRGGMGVVYKARQKSLNRLVALKLLAPERVPDANFAERFTREALALAALNHPSIVTIYDFGQAAGFYFLLMEFVDGVNLRQAMVAGRFTPEQALAIVPPICDALQYAHEHGIVHRDIKPENLLLDKDGRVKIADFGIAKMIGDGTYRNDAIDGTYFSHPVLGTPDYAAPEQSSGTVDHRTDIYSLGVVLYEMLTGERPKANIVPPSKRVQVDVRIDEIVLRALEKMPEMRYQTAGEFRTQVEATVYHPAEDPAHPPTTKSGSGRLRWIAIMGAVTGAILGIKVLLFLSYDGLSTAANSKSEASAVVAPVLLRKFALEDKTCSDEPTTIHYSKEEWGRLISGDSVEYLEEQMEKGSVAAIVDPEEKERTIKEFQARIASRKRFTAEPRTVRLYEVANPNVEDCTLLYRAKLQTEKLAGRAYLEMWCRFADQKEYFSRGIEQSVTEDNEWVQLQTPFFLKKGQKPVLIGLNVVIEGEGQVFAKDIEVSAMPASDSHTLSGAAVVRPSKPGQDTNNRVMNERLSQMNLQNSLGLLVLFSLMAVVFYIAHRQSSLLGFRLLLVSAAGQIGLMVIGFLLVPWIAMNFSVATLKNVSYPLSALKYALYAVGLAGVISLLRSRLRPQE